MASTAAVQLNTYDRGIYFIGINRRFCASGVTASALFQSGYMSVTGKIDESGNKISVKTRKEIEEQLGISPATASRNNNRLSHAGIVDKQGINTYVYRNDAEGEEIKKWYCPTEILTETFETKDDDDNTIFLRFTYCDGLVYAYFYTLLPHVGRNQRTIEATFDEIAQELGIDPSTVSDAVKKLRLAGLIYFPCGWIGKNRYKKSKIGLRRGFSWFKQEKQYRAILEEKKKKNKSSEPQQDASRGTTSKASKNDTVTRKAYYDAQQSTAEKKAAKALAEALKNKDYRKLHNEFSDIQYQYNNAIIHNDAVKQQELSAVIRGLKEKQSVVLKNIGIKPEQLNPEYYVICKECQDTGVKKDGTECNCFEHRGRGSPPGNGKKKVVGEQNNKK